MATEIHATSLAKIPLIHPFMSLLALYLACCSNFCFSSLSGLAFSATVLIYVVGTSDRCIREESVRAKADESEVRQRRLSG